MDGSIDIKMLLSRSDQLMNAVELNAQKTTVLSGILSPSVLEKQHRMSERNLILAETNETRIQKLEGLHNGKHPAV